MKVHTCNPNTQEMGAERSEFQGHPGIGELLSQEKNRCWFWLLVEVESRVVAPILRAIEMFWILSLLHIKPKSPLGTHR